MNIFGQSNVLKHRTMNAERGIDDSSFTVHRSSFVLHPSFFKPKRSRPLPNLHRFSSLLIAAGGVCALLGGPVFSSAQSGRSTTTARRTLIVNIIARRVDDPSKVR